MDGLSTAASAIAVASVAVQIADSVKKLCDFWKTIRDAPEDVRMISTELEVLSSVLTQIANDAQSVRPEATLISALNGCWTQVNLLTDLINKVEPGFASKKSCVRKWSAFKAAFKNGQTKKFQEILERMKCTLLLVQQTRLR